MARGSFSPDRAFAGAVVALLALGLAPARWTGPLGLGLLREPARFLLTPLAHPIRIAAGSLRADPRRTDEALDAASLRRRLERAQVQVVKLRAQNQELRERIVELQQGVNLFPRLSIRPVAAPVIGAPSDLRAGALVVGAGRTAGIVVASTVAIADGAHLIGRVVSVRPRSCVVQLTTDEAMATELLDAIITSDDLQEAWACQVWPAGDGRFEGALATDAQGVQEGYLVRLDDRRWPDAARMCVLGRVELIDRGEQGHLRIVAVPVVQPELVSEVVLLAPGEPEETDDDELGPEASAASLGDAGSGGDADSGSDASSEDEDEDGGDV